MNYGGKVLKDMEGLIQLLAPRGRAVQFNRQATKWL